MNAFHREYYKKRANIRWSRKFYKLKKIFQLPTDPVWYNAIIYSTYLIMLVNLYVSVDGYCARVEGSAIQGLHILIDLLHLIDIILAICCIYVPNLNLPQHSVSLRPLHILTLEILSMVPLEQLIASRETRKGQTMFCLLRLRRCLQIIRIIHYFNKQRNALSRKMYTNYIELCVYLMFITCVTYSIHCNVVCAGEFCHDHHVCYDVVLVTLVLGKLTTSSFGQLETTNLTWELTTTVATFIVFPLILGVSFAYLAIYFIRTSYHQCIFENKYEIVSSWKAAISAPEKADYMSNYLLQAFHLFWEYRKGYTKERIFLELLSPAMSNEILMDLSWPAFKHSQLFRSLDLSFLRHLSLLMKEELFLPGQYLFRKNDWKNKMYYIVSGTIQLLSEEDGESPIILFTNGTCIGESCLITSYKAINTVRCKTACEILVLEKRSFVTTFLTFSSEYKGILKVIAQRYETARIEKSLADLVKKKMNVEERQIDVYTTLWVKNTLHKLMAKDQESIYRHEFQNIYLRSEINEYELNRLLFTPLCLDMLVICDRVVADMDTVFIRTKCPCILQPSSVLVMLWEFLVIFCTLFLSVTIPYMAFLSRDSPEWYNPLVSLITYINWCDIYIQMSTATKTKDGTYTKIRQILTVNLQKVGFWADMVSCIPFEIFSTLMLREIHSSNNAEMHVNRLFKLWRLENLFRLWEVKLRANVYMVRYFKFIWIILYVSYLLYCKLYSTKPSEFLPIFSTTVQIVTGTGTLHLKYIPNHYIFFIIDIVSRIGILLLCSYIASSYVLFYLKKEKIYQTYNDISSKLKYKSLWATHKRRIKQFYKFNWLDNECSELKFGSSILRPMSDNLVLEIHELLYGDSLRSHTFFQFFSDDVIINICFQMTPLNLPPDEVICYSGDLVQSVFIITAGSIEFTNSNVGYQKIASKILTPNLVEACLGVSSLTTCVTRTHCRGGTLKYCDLLRILRKYPEDFRILKNLICDSFDIKNDATEYCKTLDENFVCPKINKQENMFHSFGYNLRVNSVEEYDYFVPFDRLYPFGFIRYFLCRSTIIPDGKFMYVWEITRYVFAVLSSLLYFVIPLVNSTSYAFLFYILDVAAIADIYVRLHMCYYDEKGVLITHPLRTATHYLTYGFLVDFIAAIPFSHIIPTHEYISYFTLNFNKLLQLRRLFQFLWFFQSDSLTPSGTIYSVIYIPVILILSNYFGSFLISTECVFSIKNTNLSKAIVCESESLLSLSKFAKPIGEIQAHLYGLYIATSLVTTIGMQGFIIAKPVTTVLISILSLIGSNLIVRMLSNLMIFHFLEYGSILTEQNAMNDLVQFMEHMGVSICLRNAIIASYELKWKRIRGRAIHELVEAFLDPLRKDILYDYFGDKLYTYSIFLNKTKTLYRNMVPLMKHDVISKGGYLETINDISGRMNFLLKGTADVLVADGTKQTTLYPGSMFGNLDNLRKSRRLVSVVANGHVEILHIDAVQFFDLMKSNRNVLEEFSYLKVKYSTYIPAVVKNGSQTEILFEEGSKEKYRYNYYFNPNTKAMRYWLGVNIFISCYVGFFLELYKLATADFSLYLLIALYFCDLLYWLQIVVSDLTAYEDEFGYLITNIKLIRKHHRRNRLKTYITIICLLPFDVLNYVVIYNKSNAYYWSGILRLNRLLRVISIFEYYNTTFTKLNVNMVMLGLQYILIWVSLVVVSISALIICLSCSFSLNMNLHVPECRELLEISSQEKFKLFVSCMYIVTNCITNTSQRVYFPTGVSCTILFIFIMILCHHFFIVCLCQIFTVIKRTMHRLCTYYNISEQFVFFLHSGDISVSLVVRVWTYLQMLWINSRGVIKPKLLYEAPIYLQDAILNDAFSHLLYNHPVFEKCHQDCLRQIVQKLTERSYFTGDYVQYKGSVDESMYFIFSGEVHVLEDEYRRRNNVITVLKSGDSFGILQGLRSTPHRYSYLTKKTTILLTLTLPSWKYLLKFFPASKETIYSAASEYTGY